MLRKSERGSITIITLTTILFMLAFLTSTYAIIANRRQAQEQIKKEMQEFYEGGVSDIDDVYDDKYSKIHTITFNTNGGTISENTKLVLENTKIGTLPIPTKNNLKFGGWYTSNDEEVTENTRMGKTDITYNALWVIEVGEIDMSGFAAGTTALQAAIQTVPADGKPTEVLLDEDSKDNIVIPNNKNIILDLNGKELDTNNTGKYNVVNNGGTLTIQNGTIKTNAEYGAVDNGGGNTIATLTLKNVNIISSTKQGVSNKKNGVLYIEDSYITSADAYPLHNRSNGTCYLKSGTIIGVKYPGIYNDGTLYIGENDETLSTSNPYIQGATNPVSGDDNVKGVVGSGYTTIYDGVIKSLGVSFKNRSKVSTDATKYQFVENTTSTETVNGNEYTFNQFYLTEK